MSRDVILAVDGGGTKTLAAVCDTDGTVLGAGIAGCGNFQAGGVEAARAELAEAIGQATAMWQAASDRGGESRVPGTKTPAYAFYGMAGADRPRDFDIVRGVIEPVNPAPAYGLENDAVIALWAGAPDGVGVGVICGTGTNVVALGPGGKRLQVGGLGPGDRAGAAYLGRQAVDAAFRAVDGRGKQTVLVDMLKRELHLDAIEDLMDLLYQGEVSHLTYSTLAPLVFEAADRGDIVAFELLAAMGKELAIGAGVAIHRLFGPDDPVRVVLAGGVFRGGNPALVASLRAELARLQPAAEIVLLEDEPLFGAIYAAWKNIGVTATPERVARLRASWAELAPRVGR